MSSLLEAAKALRWVEKNGDPANSLAAVREELAAAIRATEERQAKCLHGYAESNLGGCTTRREQYPDRYCRDCGKELAK